MSEFTDKVVLITGGTRGIGRACAKSFAQAGAKVAICGRSADSASQAAQELSDETSGSVTGFQADISSSDDVKALIKSVGEKLGPIQILVNNAGITRDGLIMRMKDDQWSDVFQTNLDGPFYSCRAVCRDMMKARWGRIINLSSIVGVRGQAGQANYSAAKAGVIGLSKALAQELAPRNITVNVVAPGFIETDMTADLPEAAQEALLGKIPAGRQGHAEEVAATVLFLASDGAAYITGHVLAVDGGLGM
ncbi:MAG: beta-ketoacyl-ACP reductase [Candidatus Hydrogenedentota bacterium]|nr:MAG: beta-ketoacyl-ACP reductase [Candidatus Hydrogenedentota bacterium]